jgi:isopenicillin N synthase-like dioxygenase
MKSLPGMSVQRTVPVVEISTLFEKASAERDAVDASIRQAAAEIGFLTITGLPSYVPLGQGARSSLLRIFGLEESARRRLWRRKFEPQNRNVYRGWFPVQPGNVTSKEGMDIGGDVAYRPDLLEPDDPLREPTPLPPEHLLPGWRAALAAYYVAMNDVSRALMQSIARSLGLMDCYFDSAFHQGLSTLRLLRYPVRNAAELGSCIDPDVWVSHGGQRLYIVGAAHTDSGFMTLLAQDCVSGLQVRTREGRWVDIPPREDALVVNFGQVLERWCAGRIRATEHRVVGIGKERYSVPFFYEARADAEISPLPLDDPKSFDPFLYGDYLWARIVGFVEFRGMDAMRAPRRALPPKVPA